MPYKILLTLSPSDLLENLEKEFLRPVPEEILSVEDMEMAGKELLRLSSAYSSLLTLQSYAKLDTREKKREKVTKREIDDSVDRKEIIQNVVDIVKQQYNAVSRAVTIRIENNQELRMQR